jgi:hypothetical protein
LAKALLASLIRSSDLKPKLLGSVPNQTWI